MPDQLDVQVAMEVNKIRRMHNDAEARLGLPRTRHERAEIHDHEPDLEDAVRRWNRKHGR